MKYVELVEKIDAVAENLKKRLRDMETNFFEEDRKQLESNEKLIVARIELMSNDDVTFASFPCRLYAPTLAVGLSETHVCVAENGSMLFRLKTEMKVIQPFFVSSVDELPYEPVTERFGWHWFKVNFTPMRNRTEMYDYLNKTVQKEFGFLNKEERRFVSSLADVLWNNLNMEVPAKEVADSIDAAASINKQLDYKRDLTRQIWEMYQSNSKQKSVKDNNKLVEKEDNIPF